MDAAVRKEILINMVKGAGQELIDRAEDFVGDTLWMTDMDIFINIPVNLDEVPSISVDKKYTPKSMFEALTKKDGPDQCLMKSSDLGGERFWK